MSRRASISRGGLVLLGTSAILCGLSFAMPRLRPVPVSMDAELASLRAEREAVTVNDDTALAGLRRQAETRPRAIWTQEQFLLRVGTGWRVEWQQPDGGGRLALLTRSDPRLGDWPAYLRFLRAWGAEPGIVLESLDVTARGHNPNREIAHVMVGLRVVLNDTLGPGPPAPVQAAAVSFQPSTSNP